MITKKRKLKKRKRRFTNILISIFLAIFLIGFLYILVSSNFKLRKRRAEIIKRIESIQKEIQRLEKENQAFQAKIFQKDTPEFLEKEARERFNLKKPGEEVVVIVEPEEALSPQPKEEKRSFWQKMFDFFSRF